MAAEYEPTVGWVLRDGRHSLADVSVHLPGVMLTLDAGASPPEVCEVFLGESEGGVPHPHAAKTCGLLFGLSLEELMELGTVPDLDPDVRPAVLALTDAEQMQEFGASPALANLVAAEAYLKLDLRNSAQAAVDQARFALVALTRYVEDRPDWVNTISTQDRLRLRTALELVTAYGLAGDDWYSGRFSELARRMAVATGHQDAPYVAAGALAADNVVTLAQVREGKDVQPPWTCADLRLRMGSAARLFVDLKWGYNLSVDPPRARGTVSVQAGALDRLGELVARVYGWDGQLLGVQPLEFDNSVGGLPKADLGLDLDSPRDMDLAGRAGLCLEIVPVGHREASRFELAHVRASLARRAILQAIEIEAGPNSVRATAEALREWASALVEGTDRTAPPEPPDRPGGWLRRILDLVARDARHAVQKARDESEVRDRLKLLVPVIRDLGTVLVPTMTVAEAYELYADSLAEFEEADMGDVQGYRIDALEQYCGAGDAAAAGDVLDRFSEAHAG
jgi:hypothetical protein